MDGTGGMPVANYELFYMDSLYLETQVDLVGYAVADDYSIGDETTIPAKSIVHVIEYDPEYSEFLFEVCFPDDNANYYVAVEVGGKSPDYTIAGYPIEEALEGITYGN